MGFNQLELHGPLRIEDLMDGKQWKLLSPVAASWVDDFGKRHYLMAPTDFKTDLASVPPMFRSIIAQLGRQNLAAVLHDYCYVKHMFDSRALCDELFLEGMVWADVGWAKRNAMYAAVRAGGWKPYNKYGRVAHAPLDSL